MHEAVHNKGGTSHIARVLHDSNEEVEKQNLRQEDYDGAHAHQGTIDKQIPNGALGQQVAKPIAKSRNAHVDPVHGILAQREGDLEHQEE